MPRAGTIRSQPRFGLLCERSFCNSPDQSWTWKKLFLSQSKKHVSTLIPGYTHLQRGQPVTLGHHLTAHFDALDRNFERLMDCYKRTNLSPMGAGALASTGFRIDRERTAELLGFDSLVENSLDAVSSRDFVTETIYVCAQTMTDLSRLAEEIILWTTRSFPLRKFRSNLPPRRA